MRYDFPASITLRGDQTFASRYVAEARALLGALVNEIGEAGIRSGRRMRIRDGVQIDVQYDGARGYIRIDATNAVALTAEQPRYALTWVPRGFVLYPVSDDSKAGWGLPIQLTGHADTYTDLQLLPENLRPGLDPARWTPGGVAGQVLLTQVPNAGYPDTVRAPGGANVANAPVAYLPKTLTYPNSAAQQEKLTAVPEYPQWTAYRIEFSDYTGSWAAWKRETTRLVNELRGNTSDRALHPPIRGMFDVAQSGADASATVNVYGHSYEGYPVTYKTAADRTSREMTGSDIISVPVGRFPSYVSNSRNATLFYGENAVGAFSSTPPVVIETDPNGNPIVKITPAGMQSPAQAYQQWLDSPPHYDNMISHSWDTGTAVFGDGTVYDIFGVSQVGVSNTAGVHCFSQRLSWIGVGNTRFESAHDDVPLVSWHTFRSMNVGGYTLPATLIGSLDGVDEEHTTPSIRLSLFQWPFVVLPNTYPTGLPDNIRQRTEPFATAGYGFWEASLGLFLYSRGRVMGIAPNGHVILSAGVQRNESGAKVTYRVIIITVDGVQYLASDQVGQRVVEGCMPRASVWYADLPDEAVLHCAPHVVLRGVYGEEDTAQSGDWPWIEKNSPYSWRSAGEIDVLHSGAGGADMLGYASLWRFSPDGRRAVCLRDGGTVDEIEDAAARVTPFRIGDFDEAAFVAVDAPHVKGNAWVGGMPPFPRCHYVELTFGSTADGGMTVDRFVSGSSRGCEAHRLTPDFNTTMGSGDGGTIPIGWVRPCAVDYAAGGELTFAYHVAAWYGGSHAVRRSGEEVILPNIRQGVYFGAWDAAWPDVAAHSIWYSALAQSGGEDMFALPAQIIDVRDRVFTAVGSACPFVDAGENPDVAGYAPEYPAFVPYGVDTMYRLGAWGDECLACGVVPSEFIARMWRGSERLFDERVTNTYHYQNDRRLLRLTTFADLYTAYYGNWASYPGGWDTFSHSYPSPYTVSSYARCKSKRDTADSVEWMASMTFMPMADATSRLDLDYTPPPGELAPGTHQPYSTYCINDCGPTLRAFVSNDLTATARDLGGWMTASFGDAEALAALMQIPGANPHTAYVRVV